MSDHTPFILIELILVFGGTLLFGWWQIREVNRDQEKARAERRAQAEREGGPEGENPSA